MPTMQDVRAKFPQYDDMSDADLANALHRKFYSDMPREEFDAKIGLSQAKEPEGSGIAMNATAGVNEAIYGTLGAPVDLMRGAMNLGIRGYNAATGSEVGMIPDDSFGGSRSIAEGLGGIRHELDPQNTVAATDAERLARAGGQGVGYALAPEAALAAATRAGAVGPRVAETAGRVFGRGENVGAVAGNAAIGGVSGVGAEAAMEASPDTYDPLAGMAGGMAAGGGAALVGGVPGLLRAGGRAVGDYIAPASQAGRERLAAERLRAGATDIDAVRETLDAPPADLVPGSMPTTAQLTGDLGLLGVERGAAVKAPEPYAQRRADQNEARVGALDRIEAGGAPEKVADALRSRLKAIDDAADQTLAQARSAAQERTGALGVGMSPSASGERLRGSLETARAQTKAQERALWSAVDPDGSLVLGTNAVRSQAQRERANLTISAKPPSGEEAAIYDVLGQYQEAMPFRELADLQSRIKSEMRAERLANGESPAYARLSRLNSAAQQSLETATVQKVQQEQRAVAAGQMRADQTILANLQRRQEDWSAGAQTNARIAGGGGSSVINGTGGSSVVPGLRGAEGAPGGGSRAASSDPRMASAEPNFDAAALGRLTAARDATRERAQTFDNKTLGPIRRRPATNAPYEMAAADVPARIFFPQPRSAEAIGQYRRAVGDAEALPALRDYAVDRLRSVALREDGTFDPAKLDRWRRAHADALRAFPELDQALANAGRVSDAMGDVVKRQKVVQGEMQKGALGTLLRLDSPDDVTRTVGAMFNAQDATNRLMRVRSAIGQNEEAKKGLRQAVVDHMRLQFVGNTEAGVSGIGTMKSDAFQTFVRKNKGALKVAGFSDDEVANLQAIADDLQRANRSAASVKNPGGSDTAQNLYAASKGDKPTILGRLLANAPAAAGGVGGFVVGGPLAAFAGAVGAKTLADFRMAGIQSVDDLVNEALLNPPVARMLLAKPTSKANEAATLQMLGQMIRRSVATSAALSADGGDTEGGPIPMTPGATAPKRQPLEITIGRPAP